MRKTFRAYEAAIPYAKACRQLTLDEDLREQLNRASASIPLNLNEGSAAHTQKERHRFYNFSLRSFRETEAILRVADIQDAELVQLT